MMPDRIATPSKTKEIIEKNRFYFKKGYGQNFIIESNILDKIVDAACVSSEDWVLEIGPGIGSLTQVLAERAKGVVAVEIDKTLIPILAETLKGYSNVEIIQEDILKLDLTTFLQEKTGGQKAKIVANLPYYITTPIIMGILEKKVPVDSLTVMVQKEVAQRMQAGPSEKDYGALSVAVQYYCSVKDAFVVQPSCFMPRPKVASEVITLELRNKPCVQVADEPFFFHIVKCAFGQRRKTLWNCLHHQGGFPLAKEDYGDLFRDLNMNEQVRGEALSIQELAQVSNWLWNRIQHKNG